MKDGLKATDEPARKWRRFELMLTIAFFALFLLFGLLQDVHWWRTIGSSMRLFLEGAFLEVFGFSFFFVKWKQDRLGPEDISEVRGLLFDAAMVIGGVVCFFQAFG